MTRRSQAVLLGLAVASLFAAGCGRHAEPESGAVLYARYCASCHGVSGRGDGPAAPALVPPPTDLARLTSDVAELMKQIDGSRTVRAHGSAAMPVWGQVFAQALLGQPHAQRTALHQVQTLAEHAYRLRARSP